MEKLDYDVVIIGGGVVGLAINFRLSSLGLKTLLIEKNNKFGQETSSRNSQVIHAGMYYPTNSLKSKLCVKGNISLLEYCNKFNIPHQKIGKFIIATNSDEEVELEKIYNQGMINGVAKLERVDKNSILKLEPNLKINSGLWSPNTGIIDSHQYMNSLLEKSNEYDSDIIYNHTFYKAIKNSNHYEIIVLDKNNQETIITSSRVVNSAGLNSDLVAENSGFDIDKLNYRMQFVRGHYFRIKPFKSNLVNHLIYPSPPKNIVGLGIHITLELDGSIRLGPDVQYLKERKQDYTVDESLRSKFYLAVSRYLNGIDEDDIYPDTSGIRPKLQKEGEPFRDFIINEESKNGFPDWVNLIGIESPGLTSSLEISNIVCDYLK